ncbi:MOSC domain-containing protein [Tomitella biformata]|uniref:MOSC domain-containing protein n=1 Tax=Tomitella biformata TaxID=630403 RepID=UPI0004674327|nr:MOSC N-terminal beta barrel domain-containing protein [Tomitella biformata]
MPSRVVSLRRYPVKSMGGEDLDRVDLDQRGLVGDRWFAVEDEDGRLASGKNSRRFRRHDGIFDYRAATTADGVVVSRPGQQWIAGEQELDAELSSAFGQAVRVLPELEVPHQDAGAVSLISTGTLRWCAEHLGVDADPRRLRVNIVISSDEPFIEESWIGQTVTIGDCALRVASRIPRCRMIDIAQDGAVPRHRLLKPITEQREANLAVYADVATPGRVSVGDTIAVI